MNDRTETHDHHVEVTPTEARQARWGKPVLYVLIGATIGAVIAVWFTFASVNPPA